MPPKFQRHINQQQQGEAPPQAAQQQQPQQSNKWVPSSRRNGGPAPLNSNLNNAMGNSVSSPPPPDQQPQFSQGGVGGGSYNNNDYFSAGGGVPPVDTTPPFRHSPQPTSHINNNHINQYQQYNPHHQQQQQQQQQSYHVPADDGEDYSSPYGNNNNNNNNNTSVSYNEGTAAHQAGVSVTSNSLAAIGSSSAKPSSPAAEAPRKAGSLKERGKLPEVKKKAAPPPAPASASVGHQHHASSMSISSPPPPPPLPASVIVTPAAASSTTNYNNNNNGGVPSNAMMNGPNGPYMNNNNNNSSGGGAPYYSYDGPPDDGPTTAEGFYSNNNNNGGGGGYNNNQPLPPQQPQGNYNNNYNGGEAQHYNGGGPDDYYGDGGNGYNNTQHNGRGPLPPQQQHGGAGPYNPSGPYNHPARGDGFDGHYHGNNNNNNSNGDRPYYPSPMDGGNNNNNDDGTFNGGYDDQGNGDYYYDNNGNGNGNAEYDDGYYYNNNNNNGPNNNNNNGGGYNNNNNNGPDDYYYNNNNGSNNGGNSYSNRQAGQPTNSNVPPPAPALPHHFNNNNNNNNRFVGGSQTPPPAPPIMMMPPQQHQQQRYNNNNNNAVRGPNNNTHGAPVDGPSPNAPPHIGGGVPIASQQQQLQPPAQPSPSSAQPQYNAYHTSPAMMSQQQQQQQQWGNNNNNRIPNNNNNNKPLTPQQRGAQQPHLNTVNNNVNVGITAGMLSNMNNMNGGGMPQQPTPSSLMGNTTRQNTMMAMVPPTGDTAAVPTTAPSMPPQSDLPPPQQQQQVQPKATKGNKTVPTTAPAIVIPQQQQPQPPNINNNIASAAIPATPHVPVPMAAAAPNTKKEKTKDKEKEKAAAATSGTIATKTPVQNNVNLAVNNNNNNNVSRTQTTNNKGAVVESAANNKQQQQMGGAGADGGAAPLPSPTPAAPGTGMTVPEHYRVPQLKKTHIYTLPTSITTPNGTVLEVPAHECLYMREGWETGEQRESASNLLPQHVAAEHRMMDNHPANATRRDCTTGTELSTFDFETFGNIHTLVDRIAPVALGTHAGCAVANCKCCEGTVAKEVTPVFLHGPSPAAGATSTVADSHPASSNNSDNNKDNSNNNNNIPLPRTYHHEMDVPMRSLWEAFDCPYGVEVPIEASSRTAAYYYSPTLVGLHLTFAPDSPYVRRLHAKARAVRQRAAREGPTSRNTAASLTELESSDDDEALAAFYPINAAADGAAVDDEDDHNGYMSESDALEASFSSASSFGTTSSTAASTHEFSGPSPVLSRLRQNQAIAVSALIHDHRRKIRELPRFAELNAAEQKYTNENNKNNNKDNNKDKAEGDAAPFSSEAVLAQQTPTVRAQFAERLAMIKQMKRNLRRSAENILWFTEENPEYRLPLYDQIETLARHRYPALMRAKNTDFTFNSWVAVLWQPIHATASPSSQLLNLKTERFLVFYAVRPPRFIYEPKRVVGGIGAANTTTTNDYANNSTTSNNNNAATAATNNNTGSGHQPCVFSPMPLPQPHPFIAPQMTDLQCQQYANEQSAVFRTDRYALSVNIWSNNAHAFLQRMIVSPGTAVFETGTSPTLAPSAIGGVSAGGKKPSTGALVVPPSTAVLASTAAAAAAAAAVPSPAPVRAHGKLATCMPVVGLVGANIRSELWFRPEYVINPPPSNTPASGDAAGNAGVGNSVAAPPTYSIASLTAPLFLTATATNIMHQQEIGREMVPLHLGGEVTVNAVRLVPDPKAPSVAELLARQSGAEAAAAAYFAPRSAEEAALVDPNLTPILLIYEIMSGAQAQTPASTGNAHNNNSTAAGGGGRASSPSAATATTTTAATTSGSDARLSELARRYEILNSGNPVVVPSLSPTMMEMLERALTSSHRFVEINIFRDNTLSHFLTLYKEF